MSATTTGQRFAPAPDATRSGRVGWLGVVLAIVLVALGVLLVREALVAADVVTGEPWLAPAVDAADGIAPSVAVSAAGVVVALLGVWLVTVAFGRRVRTRLPVRSASDDGSAGGSTGRPTGVTIGLGDVARLAASAAEDVNDVLTARASATRRTVTVTVTVLEGDDVDAAVRAAVTDRLAPLASPVAVKVASRVTSGLRTGGDGR